MSNLFKVITGQKPFIYGFIYLGLIPLFAIIYSALPSESLNLNDHFPTPSRFIYFSVITITTLGYGDITPLGTLSQLLTALESVLGIMLIGLFLNSLSHQHALEVQENEKKLQNERDQKLSTQRFSAFNRLVEHIIERHVRYTITITTPISERNNIDNEINENFKFSDMQDLFNATLHMNVNYFTPAVEYYFKSLKELVNSLEEMVKLGYVQHWSDMEELCLQFISSSKDLDFSEYILNQPNIRAGDKKMSDFDVEIIKKHDGEVKFIPSNTINAYVALYFLVHSETKFIKDYRKLASQIQNS